MSPDGSLVQHGAHIRGTNTSAKREYILQRVACARSVHPPTENGSGVHTLPKQRKEHTRTQGTHTTNTQYKHETQMKPVLTPCERNTWPRHANRNGKWTSAMQTHPGHLPNKCHTTPGGGVLTQRTRHTNAPHRPDHQLEQESTPRKYTTQTHHTNTKHK